MALDYISIDNTCPKVRLWQQYCKNQTVKDFFQFLKTYWQEKYFTELDNFQKALSVYNAYSEYLYYFSENILNIKVPIYIQGLVLYDSGFHFDSGNKYDNVSGTEPLTTSDFKRVLYFTLNWSMPNWDIPTLYRLVADFTELTWDDILIEQDSTNLDLITITLPSTTNTLLFQQMVGYYKSILGFPFGIDFVIITS